MNVISMRAVVNGRRIDYEYDVSGPWKEAFAEKGWFVTMNEGHAFYAEYDDDLTGLPQSLAILPLLANILPVAWFYDAEIRVPELDARFHACLPAVKTGMQERHPDAKLGGRLIVEKFVHNRIDKGDQSISLFSGGVDATFTAVSNLETKPILTTVWGADIYLRQSEEWEKVAKQNAATAAGLGLGYASIKSSFRSLFDYEVLREKFVNPLGMSSWWYSVQHSIVLVCLAAPLAWSRNASAVFLASSYSVEDDPATKCCNWPNIDGNVRYAGLASIHHDFAYTRQMKVRALCDFVAESGKNLNLRVCWKGASATNCCDCEKCARTIYGITAERHDPNNFGFACTDEVYARLEERINARKIRVSSFWDAVAERMAENVPDWRRIPHIAAMMRAHARATQAAIPQSATMELS